MNQECLCDCETEANTSEEKESSEENLPCNRIFLNFTREYRHTAKDNYNVGKVKDLFKYLSERQDLQEMKVSGWLDEERPEENLESEEEEVEQEDLLESYYDEKSSCRGKGQRFAMSRDFWYRKLNTLKAQKLDEAALEAKDLPPNGHKNTPVKLMDKYKVFSSESPEKREEVFAEIDEFDRTVAKPFEKEFKKRFINVYDNQKQLKASCN